MEIEDYHPEVTYNSDKPSLIPIRLLDVSKLKEKIGFETEISLKEGLEKTISWYKKIKKWVYRNLKLDKNLEKK